MKEHQRNTLIHFYDIGLAGKDKTTDKKWKMMTLKSIIKMLHHENVSFIKIRHCQGYDNMISTTVDNR